MIGEHGGNFFIDGGVKLNKYKNYEKHYCVVVPCHTNEHEVSFRTRTSDRVLK
jgi:hypothetical protein